MKKKILALVLALFIVLVQIPIVFASAANSDVRQAANTFSKLDDTIKVALLGKVFDYIHAGAADDTAAPDANSVISYLKSDTDFASVWNKIVTDGGTNGTISEASVKTIIEKLLENRNIMEEAYNRFDSLVTKAQIRDFVAGKDGIISGEDFTTWISLFGPIVTSEISSGNIIFKPKGDVKDLIESRISSLLVGLLDDNDFAYIAIQFTDLAETINNYYEENNIDPEDIIAILQIYDLYQAPTSPALPSSPKVTPASVPGDDVDPEEIISEVAETIGKLVSGITDSASAEEASKQGVALINETTAKLAEVTNANDAIKIVTSIVENGAALIGAVQKQGASVAELQAAVIDAANKAVTAIGAIASEAVVDDSLAKITVARTDELLATIADAAKVAGEANKALVKAGIEAQIPAVLTIAAASGEEVQDIEIEIASEILTAAAVSKVAVAVNTDIAAITLPAAAIIVDKGSTLTLTASIASADDLTKKQKAAAGSNAVYDFNAFINNTKVSSFETALEIAVPYTLKKGENPECITIFCMNGRGELENVIGIYDAATETVRFTTVHFSKFIVKYNLIEFKDMDKAKWAKAYVDAVAAKGIIKGNGRGSFYPLDNITKGQFVALVMRTLKLIDNYAIVEFKDIDTDYILYPEIASAYELGIISTDDQGNFGPDSEITREEMAIIIGKVLETVKGKTYKAGDEEYLSAFKDKALFDKDNIKYVALAAKYGIFIGGNTGNFNPQGTGARASVAAVIYRLLNMK